MSTATPLQAEAPNQSEAPAQNTANNALTEIAQACKAMGDPLRLAIVQLLGRGSFGVLELSEIFDTRQSGMSHHLKTLAQAGLVTRQREGNSIFYRRPLVTGEDAFSNWLRTSFQLLDQNPAELSTQERLKQVMADRSAQCAEFFERNAEAFREQQDLIASWDQYGDVVESLLQELPVSNNTALEIGPGAGEFLQPLAQKFSQVMAVDISAPMLKQALNTAESQGLDNVLGIVGDSHQLGSEYEQGYNLVAANMVLHHMPEPKDLFAESRRLLATGGYLLITDLCPHDQNWARESCGDLWLGFEPDDLSAWAAEAGLAQEQSQFLGLRNGFQIQFRLFYRA
ncbi:MAG: ArsR/SmtB family transcription factor [Oceanobacter sp.]